MTFISERRLFARQPDLSLAYGYVFEGLMLLIAAAVVLAVVPQLGVFVRGPERVDASPSGIALIGSFPLYGLRIAMFVARVRRNRMPQTIEWLLTLFALIVPFTVWLFDGTLLTLYARLHGYAFCHAVAGEKLTTYVFALHGTACPPS